MALTHQEAREIISRVKYPGTRFRLIKRDKLIIIYDTRDMFHSRDFVERLTVDLNLEQLTEVSLVEKIESAIKAILFHEMNNFFRYKNQLWYDQHAGFKRHKLRDHYVKEGMKFALGDLYELPGGVD